ncbi:hypothetical protein [Mesorhizobium sp. 8]|uniref:hypothetical protein n=1 Tax=Mesorhizobium sp. 8 TaxID=2584466 RepID=UPI0011241A27|nr:hypothetical protein [Mesorhizobium sp. 8]QDB99731.1 hypothetical protein FGU64_04530 [Mesorhizobium sp. 8]
MNTTTARKPRHAVHKPFDTAPIGRCTTCGRPTYDMTDLNGPCDCGRAGVMASVAMQDWRRCPACRRTGKSLIAANTADGSCPVCHGAGWITAAEYPTAESELVIQQAAVDIALDAATGQRVAASRFRLRSKLGSLARLTVGLPYDMLRRLQTSLLAYQCAVEKRTATGPDDENAAAPNTEPPRLIFRSVGLSGRDGPIQDDGHLSHARNSDAERRQHPALDR